MKGTRRSEEQIIAILKQGEAGLTTAELCRQHGITEQTISKRMGYAASGRPVKPPEPRLEGRDFEALLILAVWRGTLRLSSPSSAQCVASSQARFLRGSREAYVVTSQRTAGRRLELQRPPRSRGHDSW
jgi:hypothetical protein